MNNSIYPNLGQILNRLEYHYYYPRADRFLDLDLPLNNFHTLPLPPNGPKNSAHILKNFRPTVPEVVIIPFKPSAKIEHLCRLNNWRLAAGRASLNRLLEDKHQFTSLAAQHQLPLVPYLIGPLSTPLISKAKSAFGPNLVIQTHFGWAGQSTYLYRPETVLDVPPKTPVKIMPLLSGLTYTNNCCRTRWGSLVGPPALQINGQTRLSSNPFATTGRQWPSFLPQSLQTKIYTLALKVDDFLANHEFRGFYGVDYLITDNQIFVLEINPRLTASTNFYTQLELNSGQIPTIYWHLAEFLKLSLPSPKYDFKSYFEQSLQGTEITPKSPQGLTIQKISLSEPVARGYPPIYDFSLLNDPNS